MALLWFWLLLAERWHSSGKGKHLTWAAPSFTAPLNPSHLQGAGRHCSSLQAASLQGELAECPQRFPNRFLFPPEAF